MIKANTMSHIPKPPSWPKLTGGKRAPSCPLVMSSSSESDEEENEVSNVPMEKSSSPRINLNLNTITSTSTLDSTKLQFHKSTTSAKTVNQIPVRQDATHIVNHSLDNQSPGSLQSESLSGLNTNYATDHDHDYENIASPCSSTASGPTYVRPPGFDFHAQEIISCNSRIKKKKTLLQYKDSIRRREPTPPKVRPKRDPLPMKLRALPQSFWQQPNTPHQVSPGSIFPVLPPLSIKDTGEDVTEVRPVTPPGERDKVRLGEQQISPADTELLFRLFDGINEEKKPKSNKRQRLKNSRPVLRGKSHMKGLLSGNDPYLVDAVTEKLFPQLSLENCRNGLGGVTSLQVITVPNGDKTLTLPTLSVEQNFPQILSELVMHI